MPSLLLIMVLILTLRAGVDRIVYTPAFAVSIFVSIVASQRSYAGLILLNCRKVNIMSAIVSSDSGNYDVYLGFWINWSLGKMKGATLTTTKESGGLLIAFIALYVSTSGRSFWRVSCFFLHRLFSSYASMDGLYHTRQIILRNADTAAQATTSLLWAFGWRKRASRPVRRILPVLVYAVVVWAAFTVSGKLAVWGNKRDYSN